MFICIARAIVFFLHQDKLGTHKVKSGQTSLQVAVEMPFDIKSLECPTHPVKVKVRSVPSANLVIPSRPQSKV